MRRKTKPNQTKSNIWISHSKISQFAKFLQFQIGSRCRILPKKQRWYQRMAIMTDNCVYWGPINQSETFRIRGFHVAKTLRWCLISWALLSITRTNSGWLSVGGSATDAKWKWMYSQGQGGVLGPKSFRIVLLLVLRMIHLSGMWQKCTASEREITIKWFILSLFFIAFEKIRKKIQTSAL